MNFLDTHFTQYGIKFCPGWLRRAAFTIGGWYEYAGL